MMHKWEDRSHLERNNLGVYMVIHHVYIYIFIIYLLCNIYINLITSTTPSWPFLGHPYSANTNVFQAHRSSESPGFVVGMLHLGFLKLDWSLTPVNNFVDLLVRKSDQTMQLCYFSKKCLAIFVYGGIKVGSYIYKSASLWYVIIVIPYLKRKILFQISIFGNTRIFFAGYKHAGSKEFRREHGWYLFLWKKTKLSGVRILDRTIRTKNCIP